MKARFSLISDAYANNNTSGINKWLATNGTIAVVMLGDVLMECPATASHLSRLVAANGTAEIRTQMRIGKPYQTASERSGCDIGKPRRLGYPGRESLLEGRLVSKQALEPRWRKLGISDGVLNALMAEISLYRPGIDALIG